MPGDVDRLDELAERGVVGFKAFMCPSGMDDFPAADDDTLHAGMERAARLGLPVAVHAENAELTTRLAGQAVREGRTSLRDFLASRPVVAELEAIERAVGIAEETGCSLHVVHVSTGSGVQLVAAARARGVDVTCETCPHYLALDEDDALAAGHGRQVRAAASRPVRISTTSGAPSSAGSSTSSPPITHRAHPSSSRVTTHSPRGEGSPAARRCLRVLLTEGPPRGLLPEAVAHLTSAGAARRFELGGKGSLAEGADADLALVDLGVAEPVTADGTAFAVPAQPVRRPTAARPDRADDPAGSNRVSGRRDRRSTDGSPRSSARERMTRDLGVLGTQTCRNGSKGESCFVKEER